MGSLRWPLLPAVLALLLAGAANCHVFHLRGNAVPPSRYNSFHEPVVHHVARNTVIDLHGRPEQPAFTIDLPIGRELTQVYRVIVDTGSSNLGIVTKECKCESALGIYYKPGSTPVSCSTLPSCGSCSPQNSQCALMLSYGDGTLARGRVYEDVLRLPNRDIPIYVGGISSVGTSNGGFGTFSDRERSGILGLASMALANGIPPFVDRVFGPYKDFQSQFSMCFGDDEGGKFILGPPPGKYINGSDPTRIPMNDDSFYGISFQSIGFSQPIDTSSLNMILDSGTTLTLLAPNVAKGLDSQLSAGCAALEGLSEACEDILAYDTTRCMTVTENTLQEILKKFPEMIFSVLDASGKRVDLNLAPSGWLRVISGSFGVRGLPYCIGKSYYALDLPGVTVGGIIGLPWLKHFFITYDRGNKEYLVYPKKPALCRTDSPALPGGGLSQVVIYIILAGVLVVLGAVVGAVVWCVKSGKCKALSQRISGNRLGGTAPPPAGYQPVRTFV